MGSCGSKVPQDNTYTNVPPDDDIIGVCDFNIYFAFETFFFLYPIPTTAMTDEENNSDETDYIHIYPSSDISQDKI